MFFKFLYSVRVCVCVCERELEHIWYWYWQTSHFFLLRRFFRSLSVCLFTSPTTLPIAISLRSSTHSVHAYRTNVRIEFQVITVITCYLCLLLLLLFLLNSISSSCVIHNYAPPPPLSKATEGEKKTFALVHINACTEDIIKSGCWNVN